MGSTWAGVGAGGSHRTIGVVVMVVMQVVRVMPRRGAQQQVALVTLRHQQQSVG